MKCPNCGKVLPDPPIKRSLLDMLVVLALLFAMYRLGQMYGGYEMLRRCAEAVRL